MTEFNSYCRVQGLSLSTAKKYIECVDQMLREYPEHIYLQKNFQDTYVINRLDNGISKNTIAIYLKAWRHYLAYKGIEQPRTGIKNLKQSAYTKTFSEQHITTLNDYCIDQYDYGTLSEKRWAVFWLLVIWTGSRCGEIANSTVAQYNMGTNSLVINATKTNNHRSVPIPEHIRSIVYTYLGTVKKYLFPGFNAQSWQQNFRKMLAANNINHQGFRPHSFRHTFISMLLDEDVAMPKVMALVGHKRIETTFGYTHLLSKSGRKALQKHPVIKNMLDPIQKVKEYMEQGLLLANADPLLEVNILEAGDQISITFNTVR